MAIPSTLKSTTLDENHEMHFKVADFNIENAESKIG